MGQYLVRYEDTDGSFFHNAANLADNLVSRGAGMDQALVIHDEAVALRIAKMYQGFGMGQVEILVLDSVPVWTSTAPLPMREHPDMG